MIALIAPAALSALVGWAGHALYARQALSAARRDPVTGLPTRAAWSGQASRMLRGREERAVGLIDLDRFKQVNDTYGHAAGDELLAVTAARLRSWADRVGGGACGRLGGDEFVFITCRPVTAAEAAELAGLLAGPVTLHTQGVIPAAASVGIAACAHRRALSAGLAAADAAMYEAKRTGGGYRVAAAAAPRSGPAPRARARHHGLAAPRPAVGKSGSGSARRG
jgi:diguanylate cyclase (GGDEF)-like protein